MPKNLKDGAYIANFDEHAFFCNRSEIVYFDIFGVEYVPQELKNLSETKT